MLRFRQQLGPLAANINVLLGLYIVITIVASVHPMLISSPGDYALYNNYKIFKESFFHLIHNEDLYILYPSEQFDLYKYSPAFALFMGLLAWMPDMAGAIGWNLLNALVLFFSIRMLPQPHERARVAILWFVLLETLTSIQNYQSNALVAGLIIFAFWFFERRQVVWAALCIALTIYIKIFGLVAVALFLLYPQRFRFLLAMAGWTIVLAVLPLVVVSPSQLQFLYESWGRMLAEDHSLSYGFSVMGWLQSWFGLDVSKNLVVLLGALVFCLPYLHFRRYSDYCFRLFFLASVLLWVIIFNHKAESPTFVIAIAGVALWYFSQSRKPLHLVLVVLAFVFTCLSPTDMFPAVLRKNYVEPYVLKAVPCILIWFKLQYDMLTGRYTPILER